MGMVKKCRRFLWMRLGLSNIFWCKFCSMDFGCVTHLYVYRLWGGEYPIEEIESALVIVREQI